MYSQYALANIKFKKNVKRLTRVVYITKSKNITCQWSNKYCRINLLCAIPFEKQYYYCNEQRNSSTGLDAKPTKHVATEKIAKHSLLLISLHAAGKRRVYKNDAVEVA